EQRRRVEGVGGARDLRKDRQYAGRRPLQQARPAGAPAVLSGHDDWRRSEDRPRCDRALSGAEKGIRRPQNPRRRGGPLITCPASRGEDGPLVRQGGAALNKSRLCVASLCALALLVVNSASSFAQATASISGTVKDPAGGLIPGATVVVKNETTG